MLENLIFLRTLFVGTVDDNRIYDIQGTPWLKSHFIDWGNPDALLRVINVPKDDLGLHYF